jgi:2,3-bisphosphoglycerate-dependent phosphoglycerate mutase
MIASTRIGWIRHGITEWNQLGRIQGVTDIPLSQEGIAQAHLLAERLAAEGHSWAGIQCSNLQRAIQTGRIIAERLGLPLIQDDRLKERSFGSAEGTTEPERIARWGADWRSNVPDQEADETICARGNEFVDELVSKHAGQSWLVVTHGSFLARMLQTICADLNDKHLANMSLTIIEKQEKGWHPLVHNCTLHLAGTAISPVR